MVVVSGQPFAFGTAGGSDNADCFTALHQQVILADLTSHHYLSVVQRLLLPSDLEVRRRRSQWTMFIYGFENSNKCVELKMKAILETEVEKVMFLNGIIQNN